MLIAGPTASGKSGLAVALAASTGGVVVNADSMQVYDGLRILTARPCDEDLARADHRLYGHVAPEAAYSTGAYLRDAAGVLADLRTAGRLPIVCGGTGLYFRALLGGIDDMPAVDPEVRRRWRERMEEEGVASLHVELGRRDPEAAERIRPGDAQRILRALELVETTGAPLSALQRRAGEPLIDEARAVKIVLTPPREILRERIAKRFAEMMAEGALDEARAFLQRPGAANGLAAKAIGIPELGAHLRGEMPLATAIERSVTRSRQYAKRQDTWFRHQLGEDWPRYVDPREVDLAGIKRQVGADQEES